MQDDRGVTTISNDGATIMKLLDIVHPAAKSLVDIARSQDSEVGDGTTTVVILAGEFLRECKPFVEDGVHPQNIIKYFREAAQMAIARVKELSVSIEGKDAEEKRELLKKCAMTTLSSKLVGGEKEFFGQMCVDAVMHLDQDLLDPRMIGIKKVMGGSMRASFLVDGVAFKKTFALRGFRAAAQVLREPQGARAEPGAGAQEREGQRRGSTQRPG